MSGTTVQYIYIRVRRDLIQSIPTHVSPSGHLYLIKGTMQDIRRYAGETIDWVIKVAHLICSPTGHGQLYTHTAETPQYWYDKDRGTDWRQVLQGEPLLPGIYEFESSVPIVISRLSYRHPAHSITSPDSESDASTFSAAIMERDGDTCVVTSASSSFVASHLIPKRMGTEGAKAVVTEFVGAQAAIHVHKFHPTIGLSLITPLSDRVDQYILGFYHNTGDTYTLHNFDVEAPDVTLDGTGIPLYYTLNLPRLHSHQVTLSVHAGPEALPPKGVFDWHYLQCVAKRFGTRDYTELPNIYFTVYPFKTIDDDDDDTSDDDEFEFDDYERIEPPYPTYRFDRFMAEQVREQLRDEQAEDAALWAAGIGPDVQNEG